MQRKKLTDFLAELSSLTDRDERMEFLIELAEAYSPVPERIASKPYGEEHLVPGCQSEAYVFTEPLPDGTLRYYFAVENPQGISAKAMAAVLDETLSGAGPEEVLAAPSDMVYEIFGRNIAMGKGQGLMGMLFMVQALTKQHLSNAR